MRINNSLFSRASWAFSMFREVTLPKDISGKLYFHSMPGRYETLEATKAAISEHKIEIIICLTSLEEAYRKSPDYASAIYLKRLPLQHELFPVPDFGVPKDKEAFWALADNVATQLQAAQRVLTHCGAGIGRTGMFAVCVLLALGMSVKEAQTLIRQAGSYPETDVQNALIKEFSLSR